MIFCLSYWYLLVFMVAAFIYLIKNPSILQQCPIKHPPTDSFFKIAQMFFEHIYFWTPLHECLHRMYITKLYRLVNNTLSVMFRVAKTVAIIKQTQRDLVEPPRRYLDQKIHIITKSPHIMKRKKLLISECFCAF